MALCNQTKDIKRMREANEIRFKRDDLMLKNSEYDALERASGIIAGLAAFRPMARKKRLNKHNIRA